MKFVLVIALLVALVTTARPQNPTSQQFTVTALPGQVFVNGDTVFAGSVACPTTFVNSTTLTCLCPVGASFTIAAPCLTAAFNVWSPTSFSTQNGNFELVFDATPGTAKQDGVAGISNKAGTAALGYGIFTATTRFNSNGDIDAVHDASNYSAATVVPYSANGTYHITMDMNATTKTYNSYVGATTATRQPLAVNYAYRTLAPTTGLNTLTLIQDGGTSGTLKICNLQVLPYPGTSANLNWKIDQDSNQFQVLRGTTSGGPYTALNTAANPIVGTAYVDTTVAPGKTYFYVVRAMKGTEVSGFSNEASVALPQ